MKNNGEHRIKKDFIEVEKNNLKINFFLNMLLFYISIKFFQN